MFEKLCALLFEPHYPQRYIGRHRVQPGHPMFTMNAAAIRGVTERDA